MDIEYLLTLQGFREATGGALDAFFTYVSELGMPTAGLILAAIWYWCVNKRCGRYLLMGFQLSCLVNSTLKTIFCVYRPWVRSSAIHPVEAALSGATGYSFPSGHTANAISLYGGLGAYYRKQSKLLFACAAVLVLLIGFSRNYLGVHTPQDVAVSLAAGALILWAMERLMRWEEKASGRDVWLLVGGAAFAAALVALVYLRKYPMDYDDAGQLLVDPWRMSKDSFASAGAALGACFGWFFEKRRVRFTTDGKLWRRALRAAVGIAGLLLCNTLLKNACDALMGTQWGHFAASLIAMFFLLGLYPWCFRAVGRRLG